MEINQIIIYVMMVFMAIAAFDRCMGSPLSLGTKIDQGVAAIGPLCIPMVGMMELAPILGDALGKICTPIYHLVGADPAMAATSLLASDMGGYALAYAMADSEEAAQFSGCILGTMLGSIITFMIPVGLTLVKKEYQRYYALGLMIGIVTVPFGLITGGIVAGYSVIMILKNTLPVAIFALIIIIGLWKALEMCIIIFKVVGFIVVALSTVGFTLGAVQLLTPLVVVEDLPDILEGIKVVGQIAIVLCGAFPMVDLVNRLFEHTLGKIGRLLHVDNIAVTGMMACLANVMPLLSSCNSMSPAGVVVSMAFLVGANSVLGDFLGFVAGVDSSMIVPMISAKLVAGLISLPLAVLICKQMKLSERHIDEVKKKYIVVRKH